MRYTLLLILHFLFLQVLSQDSCVIKVSLVDCLNCYAGIKKIETADSEIKKTIVFPEISETEIKEYLFNILNISDISEFSIVVSDSIYNLLEKSPSSELYIYDNNHAIDYFLLKNFKGFEKRFEEIKIPDTIPLSPSITINNNESYFLISDRQFGRLTFVSKGNNHDIFVITDRNLTTEKIFIEISKDSTIYKSFYKYKNYLRNSNFDHVRINSSVGSKNILASYILIPDISFLDKKLDVTVKTGIIVWKDTLNYKVLSINHQSIPESYYVSPNSFTKYKGRYYLPLGATDTTSKQFVFGKFVLLNGELFFSGFTDFEVPFEYNSSTVFHDLQISPTFLNPYVFLEFSLSFFNMDSDKVIKLPLDPVNLKFDFDRENLIVNKLEYDYRFLDASLTKESIHVLFKQSDKYFIAIIDRKDYDLTKKLEIEQPTKKPKSKLYLYTEDQLLYISIDNSIIIEQVNFR